MKTCLIRNIHKIQAEKIRIQAHRVSKTRL